MAITLPVTASAAISLEEYMALIRDEVDPFDRESVISSAEALQALSQNKQLLLDIMHRELLISTTKTNSRFYSAHSFILGSAKGMTVRGNIWPTTTKFEHLSHRQKHINKVYAYDYPHDHNFDFLTVGWFGPGYETIVYEYDYGDVNGMDGEHVKMKFLERTHLSEGKVMLFREGKDIHTQFPPSAISVSLNLLVRTRHTAVREQFLFDIEKQGIRAMATGSDVARTLLAIKFATILRNSETVEVLDRLADHSPNGRVRTAARQAILELEPDSIEAIAKKAHLDPSPHAQKMLKDLG